MREREGNRERGKQRERKREKERRREREREENRVQVRGFMPMIKTNLSISYTLLSYFLISSLTCVNGSVIAAQLKGLS